MINIELKAVVKFGTGVYKIPLNSYLQKTFCDVNNGIFKPT